MSGLPEFDFDTTVEETESDQKVFICEPGKAKSLSYTKPADVTITSAIAAARAMLTTAGIKEFGALKADIKSGRKKGGTTTNYSSPKDNEVNFTLVKCTPKNYKMADAVDGKRIDAVILDEANAQLKIWSNMEVTTSETDENKKAAEIGFALKNTTSDPNARIVIDLLTGETSKVVPVTP